MAPLRAEVGIPGWLTRRQRVLLAGLSTPIRRRGGGCIGQLTCGVTNPAPLHHWRDITRDAKALTLAGDTPRGGLPEVVPQKCRRPATCVACGAPAVAPSAKNGAQSRQTVSIPGRFASHTARPAHPERPGEPGVRAGRSWRDPHMTPVYACATPCRAGRMARAVTRPTVATRRVQPRPMCRQWRLFRPRQPLRRRPSALGFPACVRVAPEPAGADRAVLRRL